MIAVYEQLNKLALENKGLQCLVDYVSRVSGCGVVVQTAKGKIIARSGQPHYDMERKQVFPIWYEQRMLAKLYAYPKTKPGCPARVIAYACQLLALELVKDRLSQAHDVHLKEQVIYDLLSDRSQDVNEALRHLPRAFKAGGCKLIFIIEVDHVASLHIQYGENYIHEIKEQLYARLAMLVSRDSLIVSKPDQFAVLSSWSDGMGLKDLQSRLAALQRTLAQDLAEFSFTIGVGDVFAGLTEIAAGYRQAGEAVRIGKVVFGPGRIIYHSELGIYQILPALRDNPKLKEVFTHWLGAVLEYDRSKGTDLLRTLEAYLECNGDIQTTAARLFIHRNTLRYRLEKLLELTGGKLQEKRAHLQYLLCIKAWRLSK